MKKYSHLIIATVSIILSLVYVANIEPQIEKPYVLGIFFLLLLNALFWTTYCILRPLRMGRALYAVAFIIALGILYLIALSTLNSLGLIDVVVVGIAEGLLIAFIIGPLRRRRGKPL